jgi:hypothetical protein
MPVGSVVARNFMDGVTILSSDVKGTVSVEFGAMNDPEGNDMQYIPSEIVASPAFQRALARGVVGLVEDDSDPDVVDALSKQVAAFQRRQKGAQEQIQATIERPTSRDSVSVFCVGPDSRGTGTCGEPIAVPEGKLDQEPPLCSRHKALAFQYVPEHKIVQGETGKPQVIWNRVTLTARESAPRA